MAPLRPSPTRLYPRAPRRAAAACSLLALAATTLPALSRTTHPAARKPHIPVLTPWEQAERARDTLESTREGTRSRADFTRVMDRFRLIYHQDPHDPHAAEAVNAVAELLAEQGRELHDPRSLQAAVGQYDFLRTQYPGSSLRVGALLAEAEISGNDLHDTAAARTLYRSLLQLYPHSALAEQARTGLVALNHPKPLPTPTQAASAQPGAPSMTAPSSWVGSAASSSSFTPVALPPPHVPLHPFHGPLATVSGIRHWSTPSYTRVAIDLGNEVQYEAARVPSPDRIFFDLHGAHLSPDLAGKSFAVTDDGFLKRIRAAQPSPDITRVVLDVNDVTEYSAFLLPNPYRLIIDIHGKPHTTSPNTQLASVDAPATHAASVPNTRAMRSTPAEVNTLSDQPGRVDATPSPTTQPIATTVAGRTEPSTGRATAADGRVVGDPHPATTAREIASTERRMRLHGKATAADATVVGEPATPARAATRTADGQTSLVRALGLKINRIVIDPGHGGHDSGTIGVGGLEEKDLVLDVALRLGKLLKERLGADVTFTRSDDTFIPLETRTAIANKAQADLFLSIHANSSPDPTARGVETYYLNFTEQADSLEVAARENAVSGQSIHQLSDLVRKITLKDKLAESREFATDVDTALFSGLTRGNGALKNRGVKKAPFVVLIGANMPSVLAEISFVTNPRDAAELREPDYKQRIAESLYRGVARYIGSLSATAPAPIERASTAGTTTPSTARQP